MIFFLQKNEINSTLKRVISGGSALKTKRYSRQIWLHSNPILHNLPVWGAEWAEIIKSKVELAWGGSLGNPGHSVDGACVQHCHVAGEALHAHARHFGWWGAIDELIAMQQHMHVSSALQQNCHSRALSQSGAERGKWTTEERDREGGGETRERPILGEEVKPDRLSQTGVGRGREGREAWRAERVERYCWSDHAPDWSLHTCATHELHSEL